MALKITLLDGRWLVNGKTLENMSEEERNFLDDFFREIRKSKHNFDFLTSGILKK